MRITGGTLRGRVVGGKVRSGVRPTSSRVREAMFSMIGQNLEGVTVLDAFGGSGLLTFEAHSRGANVTTVERNRSAARQIQVVAEDFGVQLDLRVADVRTVLSAGEWDIVMMDPPYADDPIEWVAAGVCAAGETVVIEHRSGPVMPESIGDFVMDRSRRHGDSVLTIFRRRSEAG